MHAPPRPPALLLLIPVLALLLAACGGSSASPDASSSQQRIDVSNPAAAPPSSADRALRSAAPAGGAPAATTAPAAAAAKPAAPAPAATAAASAAKPAEGAQGQVAGAAPALPALDQRIIRTGKIDVVVADIGGALRSITQMVRDAGGFIQSSNTREEGTAVVATAVLRVPVAEYDGVFQRLRDLAAPDRRPVESSESQDVTEEFADTEARLTNLKATEAQVVRLLAKAEKMEDILVVQRELTSIREQIERLQGRLNVLDRRSAFSTITVGLRPLPEARKPAPPTLGTPAVGSSNIGLRPIFSWSAADGATSYTLQVADTIDTTFANPLLTLDKVAATSAEWPADHPELRQGATYRWRVRGVNASGEGDWAAARTFGTIPAWNPLRTAADSFAVSLRTLQRLTDVLITAVAFSWWLVPLLALGVVGLRRLRRPRPALPVAAPLPPPPPPPTA